MDFSPSPISLLKLILVSFMYMLYTHTSIFEKQGSPRSL